MHIIYLIFERHKLAFKSPCRCIWYYSIWPFTSLFRPRKGLAFFFLLLFFPHPFFWSFYIRLESRCNSGMIETCICWPTWYYLENTSAKILLLLFWMKLNYPPHVSMMTDSSRYQHSFKELIFFNRCYFIHMTGNRTPDIILKRNGYLSLMLHDIGKRQILIWLVAVNLGWLVCGWRCEEASSMPWEIVNILYVFNPLMLMLPDFLFLFLFFVFG